MAKKFVAFVVKVGVTVGLFTLLFAPQVFGLRADLFGGISPRTMLQELREAQPHNLFLWLGFAAVVKFAGMFAGILRWRLLLKGQDLSIPFSYLVRSWFIGRTLGIFLPGTIGLDGFRLVDSSRYTGEVIKCTTVVAVEKLIGFIALTFLVFLTFPLGFRLLDIKPLMLAAILAVLAAFVLVSFLLLLNPRVVQVLVAVLPTPAGLRSKVDKFGAAVTAYSGRRSLLLQATFLGLLVHLGTCFMYFGTMMSIRAANTTLWDILFACPIMIYGTVLGPSIGGEGIREIVFVYLLQGKTQAASAALFSHLGWWIGEFLPFFVGVGFWLMYPGVTREGLEAGLADVKAGMRRATPTRLIIGPEEARAYRFKIAHALLAGLGGGLVSGALVGLGEGAWIARSLASPVELGVLWWGPLFYGLLFTGLGVAVAAGLVFLYLLLDRFPATARTFGFVLALCLAASVLVIGKFRLQRDVLDMHALTLVHYALLAGLALGAAVVAERIVALGFARRTWSFRRAAMAVAVAYVLVVLFGGAASILFRQRPLPEARAATTVKASGPNIILVAVDTLRADYLPFYDPSAPVKTPYLEAFLKDAVLFRNGFAHASWTKASFASIFSGLYPETHSATSKDRALPLSVKTFPEVLEEGGYYTKGFANNPNIMASSNFGQGFRDYVDLKPRMLLWASPTASNLSLYNVLRKLRIRILDRFTDKVNVYDYYQPGEAVNAEVFDWLDSSDAPEEQPFFLFVHYMDPHDPYIDHETGVGYARAQMEHPDSELLEPMRKAYYDEIAYTDSCFGALVAGLQERGLYENTVILFTSDHGEEFLDHEGWWHGQTLYDEQIHVPFLMKLPGNAAAGQANDHFARHIDIAPTLLALAGLEPDPAMQGKPLVTPDGAFLNDGTGFVFSQEDFEGNVLEAVRSHDAKLIRANEGNPRGLEPLEFYDVAVDPGEKANLAGKGDARELALDELRVGMEPVIKENAAEPELKQDVSIEETNQLDAIGYL
jgi:arylsulfatase A-like enzyme